MAKKKRKALLPKRIAGVKVPKSARKGRFGELLASRTGQALLADALIGTVPMKARGGRDSRGAEAALDAALGDAARAFIAALNARGYAAPVRLTEAWDSSVATAADSQKPSVIFPNA